MWSLWVSSLTVGYISLIFGPVIRGIQKFPWKDFRKDISSLEFRHELRATRMPKNIAPIIGIVTLVVVFLVIFFTVHFGMFHFIHGVFLNSFFPLQGDLTYPKGALELPRFAVHLAGRHWEFVLASAISQFFRLDSKKNEPNKKSELMIGPYKAVMRMHLMIFVYAFLDMIHADSFIVYAITLLVYFMPWEVFKKEAPGSPI